MTRIAPLWLLLVLPACVEVDGGAVELSWHIRTLQGAQASCTEPAQPDIVQMRVCWLPIGDAGTAEPGGNCSADERRDFTCSDAHGVTGFVIPAGRTAIWLQPICADGEPGAQGTYEAPPPIVRDIEDGQVATLNALLIAVSPRICER